MSKFIIILGPPAVGKMTVAQELSKRLALKVFHNHLIIEALLPIFNFESESYKSLVREFRNRIFEETIKAGLDGIIFTYVPNYNNNMGIEQIKQWIKLFKDNNFDIYIVELQANLEERIKRNETPHRLEHKYSKRDIQFSKKLLLKNEEEWNMNPRKDIWSFLPYLKINTDKLTATQTAESIIKYFNLI